MARSEITVGVLGPQHTSRKNVQALITDYLTAAKADPKLVLGITRGEEDTLPPAVKHLATWALDKDVPFEVVVGDDADQIEDDELPKILKRASKTTTVKRVGLGVARAVDSAGGILALAWDETDDECMAALTYAADKGIDAFDVCDGWEELGFGDEDEPGSAEEARQEPQESPEEDPAPEEEAPRAPTPQKDAERPDEAQAMVRPVVVEDAPAVVRSSDSQAILHAIDLIADRIADMVTERVVAATTAKRSPGRPRKDGTPAQPRG